MQYHKLVRDAIPAIIAAKGETPVTRILDTGAYRHELKRKLQEETAEFCASEQLEELADLLEVIYALAQAMGVSTTELDTVRTQKRQQKGGFEQRIFLVETIAPSNKTYTPGLIASSPA